MTLWLFKSLSKLAGNNRTTHLNWPMGLAFWVQKVSRHYWSSEVVRHVREISHSIFSRSSVERHTHTQVTNLHCLSGWTRFSTVHLWLIQRSLIERFHIISNPSKKTVSQITSSSIAHISLRSVPFLPSNCTSFALKYPSIGRLLSTPVISIEINVKPAISRSWARYDCACPVSWWLVLC
jgi:hypothetical protein